MVRVAGVVLTSIGGAGVVGSYFYSVFARPALWVVLGATVVVIVGMLLLLFGRLLRRRVAGEDVEGIAKSDSAEEFSLFEVLVGALLLLVGAVVVIAFLVNPSGGGTAVFALVLGVLAFLGGVLALLTQVRRARQ